MYKITYTKLIYIHYLIEIFFFVVANHTELHDKAFHFFRCYYERDPEVWKNKDIFIIFYF